MQTPGKWIAALILAAALLGVGSVRADDAETSDGAATHACLFPFGARAPGQPDAATTNAVAAGLRWLAAHQGPKGLWHVANLGWCNGKKGREDLEGGGKAFYDAGVTGMTVSAFLAAGHSHQAGTHAPVVAKALEALVAIQDREGCIGSGRPSTTSTTTPLARWRSSRRSDRREILGCWPPRARPSRSPSWRATPRPPGGTGSRPATTTPRSRVA